MTEEEKKERQRINFKKYYESHKEKCFARSKEWAKKNPEKAKEIRARYFAKYYAENKDKIAKRRKELHPRKMVEVVRCKDCVFGKREKNDSTGMTWIYCGHHRENRPEDWFCASGSRI